MSAAASGVCRLVVVLAMVLVGGGEARRRRPCPSLTAADLDARELLLQYAEWRHWRELVIFVSPTAAAQAEARDGSTASGDGPSMLASHGHRVLLYFTTVDIWFGAGCWLPSLLSVLHSQQLVTGLQPLGTGPLQLATALASDQLQFNSYVSWLVLRRAQPNASQPLVERFRYLNLALDSDVVLAELHTPETAIRRTSGRNSVSERGEKRARGRCRGGACRHSGGANSTRGRRDVAGGLWAAPGRRRGGGGGGTAQRRPTAWAQLLQVYKIRPALNSSLVVVPLGRWDRANGTAALTSPRALEARGDLQGLPLLVGVKNASAAAAEAVGGAGGVKDLKTTSVDDDSDDARNLIDVMEFVARSLNASYELVAFPMLGWRNSEGAWLHLLGAVTRGAVDVGLDNVVITKERARDMFFSFPLVESMKNIYFRRPEGGALRDIFLAPFSPRLLACVAATGALLALAAAAATAAGVGAGLADRRWGAGEAFVWSISVLCMQGSTWNPRTASGSLVLMFGLVFALVMYNAYAAFITSVLSVRVASIRGLDDLLQSDFQFGYTLAGQGEMFLRTANDSHLRRLYLRGLVGNTGVHDAAEGLRRAVRGGYAFFVSSRLARRALAFTVELQRRCDVRELPVEATRSSVALPMSRTSPFRRLLNLSLLRMREAGALARAREALLPPLPRCHDESAFNSARLADVYSAFLLLGSGLMGAAALAVAEFVWKRRRLLRRLRHTLCGDADGDAAEMLRPVAAAVGALPTGSRCPAMALPRPSVQWLG
ncbi:glutamate receptor ionotropic, delta-1-like [Schistocerca piceifrons]|uniref:glutamate receptor ionotropic, delta-1-like n=1 Tax=Schistocerca piceifrons TaxID=274613 RepID=UPI001F5EA6F5|nr:glutamate receptor ionotropic, delta-1-like [Schistocerca piceifrons]